MKWAKLSTCNHAVIRGLYIAVGYAGPVGELLDTYDRDRRVLPPPVKIWQFGWTKSAEVLNGRIAMVKPCLLLYLVTTPNTRESRVLWLLLARLPLQRGRQY